MYVLALTGADPENFQGGWLVSKSYNLAREQLGADLDFCKGESKVKLRFLRMCRWVHRSVESTLQNVKHKPSRGVWGMPPRKFLKNACSEIESDAFLGTKLLS